MKRSLKIHIFIHVLVLTTGIVFVNRVIAQWMLLDQMNSLLRNSLISSFVKCESKINEADQFFSCQRKINPGNILNNFAEFYVLCPKLTQSKLAERPAQCDYGTQHSSMWESAQRIENGRLELGSLQQNGRNWLGVRHADRGEMDGAFLLVEKEIAANMSDQLWSFRDRNLVYTLPSIVLMLMMLAIYLAYLLTRAVSSLEHALVSMNANNLEEVRHLQAPYREFESLVQVFEDLRHRLMQSFVKTKRFAADASHELKTPLTILRGNAELMINELPAGTKVYDQVLKIHEESERLIEITEKLLLMSRADANSITIVATDMNLSEFLKEMLEYGEEAYPEIRYTSNIQADIFWHCDASLVAQLIHNLHANAVKYNFKGGWIHIELKSTLAGIKIEITNTSDRIPSDFKERAFERFYRGDSAHSRKADGQGLGLSIAEEIAKVHRAKLSIRTENQKVTVILDV
jgi:signal transduction histidine kinase